MNDRSDTERSKFKPHPWHGVPIGDQAPQIVTVYVEIVPSDTIKYEVDKPTGYLKIDRPQLYSNVCPTLYGFIPQTLCGEEVAALARSRTGRSGLRGDADPLDICVCTEKVVPRGDFLLTAVPIGGFRMIDNNQADDKILAVLKGDAVYGAYSDIRECPRAIVDRLHHYFLTYKQAPDTGKTPAEIHHVYGKEQALEVIERSMLDYKNAFGPLGK
jgi:inorganic pyrophosphatase